MRVKWPSANIAGKTALKNCSRGKIWKLDNLLPSHKTICYGEIKALANYCYYRTQFFLYLVRSKKQEHSFNLKKNEGFNFNDDKVRNVMSAVPCPHF